MGLLALSLLLGGQSLGCQSPEAASQAQAQAETVAQAPKPAQPPAPPKPAPVDKPPAKTAPPKAPPAPSATPDDGLLDYLELTTGGASADAQLPLIVAVHGLGDKPERFQGLMRSFDVPARVIAPRGPKPYRRGYSWFPLARPLNAPGEPTLSTMRRSGERIAELIAHVRKTRPTQGAPIILGFSQGGLMSYLVALHHPDAVQLALPVSGWLPDALQLDAKADRARMSKLPTIRALHGDADTLIPSAPTVAMVNALKGAGAPASITTYPGVPHRVTAQMQRDLFGALRSALQAPKASP